jgi:hypothetical protein
MDIKTKPRRVEVNFEQIFFQSQIASIYK